MISPATARRELARVSTFALVQDQRDRGQDPKIAERAERIGNIEAGSTRTPYFSMTWPAA